MMKALFGRDMRLAFSRGNGLGVAILFFFTIIVLLPFSLGMASDTLARIGSGIIWIGALLSMLLGFDRLFLQDRDDGSLDILLLHQSFFSLCLFLLSKAIAHWCGAVMPLIIATPLLGLLLDMDFAVTISVLITLLVASPAITLIGLVAAALGVHLPRGNFLVAVIMLPLVIPVIIFAINAAGSMAAGNTPFISPLALLAALTLFLSLICPPAAAASLKYL